MCINVELSSKAPLPVWLPLMTRHRPGMWGFDGSLGMLFNYQVEPRAPAGFPTYLLTG